MTLDTGKSTDIPKNNPLGVSGAIVIELLGSYMGLGHALFVDSWYTNPMLGQYLHESEAGTCGTVNEKRK